MGMKNKAAVLFYFMILGGLSLYHLYNWTWDPQILVLENRRQKEIPSWTLDSLSNHKWMVDFEEAYNDRFPFRGAALELTQKVKALFRWPVTPEVRVFTPSQGDQFIDEPEAEDVPVTPPGTAAPEPVPQTPETRMEEGEFPWEKRLVIVKDRALETAGFSPAAARNYARSINGLKTLLGPRGSVTVVLVPSALALESDETWGGLSYSQTRGLGEIYRLFDPGVKTLDAAGVLKSQTTPGLYFRTDHHWTPRGAWFVYQDLGPTLGYEPLPWEGYRKETLEGFLGTLYNQSLSEELKAHPDTLDLVYPPVDHTYDRQNGEVPGKAVDPGYIQGFNKYLAYIAGDDPHSIITNPAGPEKDLLVIKDSYGNALIPYLIPHYAQIHVVDPRYWDGRLDELLDTLKTPDILVVNYFPVVSYYQGFTRHLQALITKASIPVEEN